ncbi:MAG: PAS domain-containing protein [Porphyromonadaceae bacterium]|nr:PAS domain-containing protein [Porphyromonadaceae bacterium]
MEEQKTNHIFASLDQEKLRRMLEIKQLYENGHLPLGEARARMKNEVGTISAAEFAAAEQLLKDEDPDECRNEDVRGMLEVFEGLMDREEAELPHGHTIDAYRRENRWMKELLQQGDILAQKPFILNPWLELMEQILPYKVHFSRKQNQLYSALEREGFDRPTTTMWVYDDYIRDEMNKAWEILRSEPVDVTTFLDTYREMATDLRDLMEKEEMILYPTSLKLISADKMEQLKSGDREIGFFGIELTALLAKYGHETKNDRQDQVLDVAHGKLTLEQINLLYQHMPVDISFVDENELVKFYTDTKHRVFPRSKGVIGREVRNCHPPKSIHLVEEIIEKFRSGEQSKAEFWINKPGFFVYIVYIAVRDDKGNFRGVMEMMQDCTHIRQLEGEQRLLSWGMEKEHKNGYHKEEVHGAKKSNDETGNTFRSGITADPGTGRVTDNEGITSNGNSVDQTLSGDTKLKSLLQQFPRLKEELIAYNPKFAVLNSPMAKVILPIATIKMMSEQSGIPRQELIDKINELIAAK